MLLCFTNCTWRHLKHFLNASSVNDMVYGSKLVTANFLESIPAGVKKLNRKLEKKKEERDVTKSHEELVEMKETLAIFQETMKRDCCGTQRNLQDMLPKQKKPSC